ncbi:Uma2 family endonuclease [Kitasatospora sp. NPDC008050]|uniref:Uma2 family endonuclease n=1 Tax=Kitasatospora sp. NPDC008050 TaxID=3364021 RepID=UPI0036E4880A
MTPAIGMRPGRLREAAEQIEESTGLRVQIIGGVLIMSPPSRGKHAGTVRLLRDRLDALLPSGLGAYQMSSVGMPDDEADYATPDLLVLPIDWGDDDGWLADPHDVAFSVEVVPGPERARGIADKTRWYALAGVVLLLAVDPRNGTWTLHSHPRDGVYQGVLHGTYGESVPLTGPLTGELSTTALPRYGS